MRQSILESNLRLYRLSKCPYCGCLARVDDSVLFCGTRIVGVRKNGKPALKKGKHCGAPLEHLYLAGINLGDEAMCATCGTCHPYHTAAWHDRSPRVCSRKDLARAIVNYIYDGTSDRLRQLTPYLIDIRNRAEIMARVTPVVLAHLRGRGLTYEQWLVKCVEGESDDLLHELLASNMPEPDIDRTDLLEIELEAIKDHLGN